MYYNNGFENTYEELITFYPIFYRKVLEMRAILETDGKLIDNIIVAINTVIDNSFVGTADESMIARLEAFLGLEIDKNLSLEDRRKIAMTFFAGHGKVSASIIRNIIHTLTDADTNISFKNTDGNGNHILVVDFMGASITESEKSIIEAMFNRCLPAHVGYKVVLGRKHSQLHNFTHDQLRTYTHAGLKKEEQA